MVDLKDSTMNIVRVIKKPVNLLIRIYRRLERKKRLKEKMIECSNILKTGKWRITSYGAWILNNNGNKLLKKDIFGYKERNERFSLIDQLFGLKHFNVNSNPDDDSLNAAIGRKKAFSACAGPAKCCIYEKTYSACVPDTGRRETSRNIII